MIKNKEGIIAEKANQTAEAIVSYVNELDKLSETDEFTIDNIEKLWGKLDENAREIYRETSREIIEQVDEKEIIRSKKKNISKKG